MLNIEEKNFVSYVRLNRPDVKNAMNEKLIQEIKNYFLSVDTKTSLRAVVLSGEGSFFCAGGDLQWMKSSVHKTKEENEKDARELGKMIRAIDECPIPVISVVQGGAFGGGVGLVAASDIVIAEKAALFSLSEVKLGLIPATIGPMVMRKIGMSQARRLYLTGLRFSADEAKAIGLIHETAEPLEVGEVLKRYLKELGSSGPQAIRTAKSLIRDLQKSWMWKDEVAEETSKILSEIRVQKEAQEGITAFFEKRSASWKARLTED